MNEEFEYVVSTKMDIATLVASIVLVFILSWLALTNTQALVVLGLIKFGPLGASIVYGLLAVLGMIFALVTLKDLIRPGSQYHPIMLDGEAICAPTRPGGRKTQTLTYRGMQDVKVQRVAGNRILEIKHADGSLAISSGAVGGAGFEALLESLSMRILVS